MVNIFYRGSFNKSLRCFLIATMITSSISFIGCSGGVDKPATVRITVAPTIPTKNDKKDAWNESYIDGRCLMQLLLVIVNRNEY